MNYKRKQSGVAFIELAIILLVLIFLSLLTVEISYAISDYRLIVERVGLATRYLSTQTPGSGYLQAKCLVAYGNTGCASNGVDHVLTQLDPTNSSAGLATINIVDAATNPYNSTAPMQYLRSDASSQDGVRLNLVKLEVVNYDHELLLGDFLYNTINLSTPGIMRFNNISCVMRQAN
jgi:Flp pilus assembly protein TadG